MALMAKPQSETDKVEKKETGNLEGQGHSNTVGYVSNVSHVAYGKQEAWKTSAAMSTVGGEQLMRITSPTVVNALNGLLH